MLSKDNSTSGEASGEQGRNAVAPVVRMDNIISPAPEDSAYPHSADQVSGVSWNNRYCGDSLCTGKALQPVSPPACKGDLMSPLT